MDLDDSCIEFSQVMNKTETQRVQFRRKKICRLICFMDRKPSPSPQTVPWRESYQCNVIVSMLMFLTVFIRLPRFSFSPRPHQLCSLPVPNTVCFFCQCLMLFSLPDLGSPEDICLRLDAPWLWRLKGVYTSCLVTTLFLQDTSIWMKPLVLTQTSWTKSWLCHWANYLNILNPISSLQSGRDNTCLYLHLETENPKASVELSAWEPGWGLSTHPLQSLVVIVLHQGS